MEPTRKFTFQTAAVATGNGTAGDVTGLAAVTVQVVGITVATVTFEGSVDRTNWVAIPAVDSKGGAGWAATEDGIYTLSCVGLELVRCRISAYTSGTITVVGRGMTAMAANNLVGNDDLTLLASGARTATTTSLDITNCAGRGAIVTLDVTAIAATPSIVLSIQAKIGALYENLLTASAAVTATGTHSYVVYPGVGAASADVVQVAGFPLPRTWRVSVAHGDADSITYSVRASVIL